MAEPSLKKPLLSPEQGLRRTIILSLVLHLLVLALFAGDFLPRRKVDERPVYVVDLLNLPVKDPQAGRPDAAREPQKTPDKSPEPPAAAAPPEKAPEPVKLPPKTPEPPKPEPVKPTKPAEVVKPVPSKEPPPKPAPTKEPASTDSVAQRIEDLRRKQEIEEKKAVLEAMRSKDTRGRGTDAPVGMPDGKGTEVGIEQQLWLKEFLKQAWALSKYQISRRDLEALVVLEFDPNGRLINYRFSKKSGDDRFDDSVRKAVLKLNEITLPIPPGKRVEQEAKFNLADLTD
ncbi:MAG: TonB C-terminal domain-containing protein [Trichloromonadaceae bacterium]